jgi:hypothetical protein
MCGGRVTNASALRVPQGRYLFNEVFDLKPTKSDDRQDKIFFPLNTRLRPAVAGLRRGGREKTLKFREQIAAWFKFFRVFGVFRGLEPFVLFVFFCPDFLRSNGQNGIVGPCTNWGKRGSLISAYTTPKTRHICPGSALYKTVSANGAILILAWGNAPGLRHKFTSADSAIHLRVFFADYLIRALRSR